MIEHKLARLVDDALGRAVESGRLKIARRPIVEIARPHEKGHGDWASNVALILAKEAGVGPRVIADIILDRIERPPYVADVTIAGPGFINFRLSNTWLYEALTAIRTQRDRYGWSELPTGERIQVEFVSANPVGPMHVGHGRWAAVGDSLARLLLAAGSEVQREFYINDWGNQMLNFGASVAARYRELLGAPLELPEDGYRGHYIIDIAQEIVDKDGDKYLDLGFEQQGKLFSARAYKQVLEHIKKTLEAMDVTFDCWFSERALHDSGELDETLALLEAGGYSYRADGALWLRTTDFGDDKDRVLVRENGEPTYFAADIAYHRDKIRRGYTKLIDIWGADHHGYVARMQAAMAALGAEPGSLEIIIGQLVSLYSGGRPIKMSKRTGEMVTLEELLAEVGKDAVRYFFLMRGTDTALDFDIELAKSETAENPVYYVQYAHARICSILRHAAENDLAPAGTGADLALLDHQAELALLRELAEAPSVIMRAAANRAPYRLTKYLQDVAGLFHQFYHQCRVVSDDEKLSVARLALCDGTRQVIKNVLWLIGVSAPEKM
ncbi:MAG: arginine--tRNA ligase [Actinomycetota bacterium]|nr:arginine--tRNA ligase [Actinomycetota bacterium]